jgi:hypothetical protein
MKLRQVAELGDRGRTRPKGLWAFRWLACCNPCSRIRIHVMHMYTRCTCTLVEDAAVVRAIVLFCFLLHVHRVGKHYFPCCFFLDRRCGFSKLAFMTEFRHSSSFIWLAGICNLDFRMFLGSQFKFKLYRLGWDPVEILCGGWRLCCEVKRDNPPPHACGWWHSYR